jgi:hypothetical protein
MPATATQSAEQMKAEFQHDEAPFLATQANIERHSGNLHRTISRVS